MTTGGTNQPPFVISSPWRAQLLPPALQLCAEGPPKWSECPPARRRHDTNRRVSAIHRGSVVSLSKLLSCDQPKWSLIYVLPSGSHQADRNLERLLRFCRADQPRSRCSRGPD